MSTPTDAPGPAPLVDWSRTGRRLAVGVAVTQSAAVVAWLVTGAAGSGLGAARLLGFVGLGLLAGFLVEVVVVGGSAVRGMLRAGARGERLASGDVGLLPPRPRRPDGTAGGGAAGGAGGGVGGGAGGAAEDSTGGDVTGS